MSSNYINAKIVDKKAPSIVPLVSDIYISVFFDGTNNNMVKKKGEVSEGTIINQKFIYETDSITADSFNRPNTSIADKYEMANAYNKVKPNLSSGYSNIAILYYMANKEKKHVEKPNALFHNIYIEGAGATDQSHISSMNINGLGFGLGDTGVVALVSKAVKYVNQFVINEKSHLGSSVNIHFFVYGFSRGATCSRLFSHLVTRGVNSQLPKVREKEFSNYYAKKYYCDDKLHFLDGNPKVYKGFNVAVNKTVDFLGIYDTVASIGFLKQADGWTNIIGMPYQVLSEQYNNNWHYKNVTEYGLFISDKVKKTCHVCALDEFRENFALTDVGRKPKSNMLEVFIPGCHSDVGGGYFDGDKSQEFLLKTVVEKGTFVSLQSPLKNVELQTDTDKKYPQAFHIQKNSGTISTIDNVDNKEVADGRNNVMDYPVTVFLKNPQKSPLYNIPLLKNPTTNGGEYIFMKNEWKSFRNQEMKNGFKDYPNLLSELSLERLGWVERGYKRKLNLEIYNEKSYKKTIKEVNTTISLKDESDVVKFKKNTKSGYSNIPLMMLYKKLLESVTKDGIDKFLFHNIPSDYSIPKDLQIMASNMLNNIKGVWGKRLFLIPDNDYSGVNYRALRLKYLHFTSTDAMFHINWKFWDKGDAYFKEGTLGNIANTPNHDLKGRICRIVYHGDENENKLSYMYEYNQDSICISCGGELKFSS